MRVGIIGTGTMGKTHAKGWRATSAELVGVSSKNVASAAELAQAFETRVFQDIDDLLQSVDIIDLCVPTDLHKTMTLRAAEAGVHVLCEKPIALNISDAHTMIDACQAAGVRLFIGMVVRFFPQYRRALDIVRAGQLGDLAVMHFKRVAYPPSGDEGWFGDEARSGGLLLDLMVHDFDMARALGGEVERVYAQSVKSLRPDAESDYALVTLAFSNGARALVEGGWAYPPGYFRTGFDLAGSKGALEWSSDESTTLQTFLAPQKGDAARVGVPTSVLLEDPYSTEIGHAYRAIEQNTAFEVTAQDALEALRIALAAKASLTSGDVVRLEH